MKKVNLKEARGITLVALVITIIILLILAGVTLSLVIGENGILTQTRRTKEQTERARQEEESKIDSLSSMIENVQHNAEIFEYNNEGYITGFKEEYKVNGSKLSDKIGTTIYIPREIDGIKIIGIDDWSLYGYEKLDKIIIPETIQYIGDGAFAEWKDLKNIVVDEKNTKYTIINGCLYSKDGTTLIQYPIGKEDKTFEIPGGTINVGGYAFASCKGLSMLMIPKSVHSLGDSAFSECFESKRCNNSR